VPRRSPPGPHGKRYAEADHATQDRQNDGGVTGKPDQRDDREETGEDQDPSPVPPAVLKHHVMTFYRKAGGRGNIGSGVTGDGGSGYIRSGGPPRPLPASPVCGRRFPADPGPEQPWLL